MDVLQLLAAQPFGTSDEAVPQVSGWLAHARRLASPTLGPAPPHRGLEPWRSSEWILSLVGRSRHGNPVAVVSFFFNSGGDAFRCVAATTKTAPFRTVTRPGIRQAFWKSARWPLWTQRLLGLRGQTPMPSVRPATKPGSSLYLQTKTVLVVPIWLV